jgi:hypothetical protein
MTMSRYDDSKVSFVSRDDSVDKAIDEFMRSPRSLRKSIVSATSKGKGANLSLTNSGVNPTSTSTVMAANSTKKTGVCVSKCYQMLCGRCGRRFSKIMVVDMMHNEV